MTIDTNPGFNQLNKTTLVEPLVTFYKAYPDSLPAMSADRSALGTIPAQAYQYCEALTTASAFGWYIFPAATVTLIFDGTDIYRLEGDTRILVRTEQLSGMDEWWNNHCPKHLTDKAPPFLTSLGVPGYLQVWSGLLIKSRKNWSTLARPIANVSTSNQYFCFEGIVETDEYCPAPLFVNIKLQATNTPILLSASAPLFQIQPIHRECYSKNNHQSARHHTIDGVNQVSSGMSEEDWKNYSSTVREVDPAEDLHRSGQYAADVRRKSKRHETDYALS